MNFYKIKFDKETLVTYWKKGWKVWLMMLCINIAVAIVVIPIMIPLAAMWVFLILDMASDLVPFVLAIILGPPMSYYVFTLFYGKQ